MAIKMSTISKAPGRLPYHRMVQCHTSGPSFGISYPYIELQSAYSLLSADRAKICSDIGQWFCVICTRWNWIDIYFLFFQWHINLHLLFKAKAILEEEQQWYNSTHSFIITRFLAFNVSCLKAFSLLMFHDERLWAAYRLVFKSSESLNVS